MKRLSKKGFTLIELIIAISILSVTLLIGYNLINKTYEVNINQERVSDIQSGINNLRKFMTDDLKMSKNITISNLEEGKGYKYKIIMNDISEVEYEVDYDKSSNMKFYNIKRNTENNSLELISKQPIIKETSPLLLEERNGIYNIKLCYGENMKNEYTFDVYNNNLKITGNLPEDNQSNGSINYINYCMNKALDSFNQAKSALPPGHAKKLEESIGKNINELVTLSSLNDNTLQDKILSFRDDQNKNQELLAFNPLNKMLLYTYAGNQTAIVLKRQDYDINYNNMVALRNDIENKIVYRLHKSNDYRNDFKNIFWLQLGVGNKKDDIRVNSGNIQLVNMHQKVLNEFIAIDIKGNDKIYGNMQTIVTDLESNQRENIKNKSIKIVNYSNDLINKIIDVQVELANLTKFNVPIDVNPMSNGNSKVSNKNIQSMRLNSQKSIEEFNNAIQEIIELKYKLNLTNYIDLEFSTTK